MALIRTGGGAAANFGYENLESNYQLANSTDVPKSFTLKKGEVLIIRRDGSNTSGNVTISNIVNGTLYGSSTGVTGNNIVCIQASADGACGATFRQAISSDIYLGFAKFGEV